MVLTTLELVQCNKPVPSVLIGWTRVGSLMGQSGDDDIPKRKYIQLLIVPWGIVESLRSHERWSAFYGGLLTEGGWVDGTTHSKITDLGHERGNVHQHVVGAQVMMDERRILAVEIRQRFGHLTKDERLLMEGELLLPVILQVHAKTGVHLLHHEYRQARSAIHMHPQELDHVGVTQLRPRQALCLEVADQFRYSAGGLVF